MISVPADAVHKGVGVLRRVELQDPGDVRDVQPPRRHVRAEQRACTDRLSSAHSKE